MQAYQENISAKVNGVLTPILGVKVTVTDDSTGNPATLFSDNGITQITGDIVTDETGYFGFRAANGSYTVSFSSPQIRLAPRNIDLYDPLDDAPLTQSQAAAPSGASSVGYGQRSVANKLTEIVSVKDSPFNARGDGVTDDTAAVELARTNGVTSYEIPQSTYKVNNFRTLPNAVYRGIGNPVMAFNFLSATVWLAFQSGSRYEGITFQSNEPNLPWQRGAIEDVHDVTIRDCALKGFRDAAAAPNAWGLHIARSNGILIDNVEFANNSQSDIAITDSVSNVTIINAKNPTNGGVVLDIEPNGNDGINGLSVVGGRYKAVYLLENDNQGYASRNIVFNGAQVDAIYYDGSGALFNRCNIGTITNAPDGIGSVYGGALMIDNCQLGPNLIADPYFFGISNNDADCFWTVYATGSAPYYNRINDAVAGKYLKMNPAKQNAAAQAVTRNKIPVVAGEKLMMFLRARCDNSTIAGVSTLNVLARWYDAGGATLSDTQVRTCRSLVGLYTDWSNDIAILVPPAGATQMNLFLGAPGGGYLVAVDLQAVGLFRFTLLKTGMGNMPEVIGSLSSPNFRRTYQSVRAPSGSKLWPQFFVGERIENTSGIVGQPKAWTLTAAAGTWGDSGTWTSEGNL